MIIICMHKDVVKIFMLKLPIDSKLKGINNSHFIMLMNCVGQEFEQRIAGRV